RSPFGAALAGIRINEQRMRAAGYSTFPYKLAAYVIGGAPAGLAGFLYALKDGFVTPELLAWEQSGLVLLMVILGGMGRLGGAVLGAAALILLQELFQSQALLGDYAKHWHLPLGLAIIALVALLPDGLAGLPAQWRARRAPARRPGPQLRALDHLPGPERLRELPPGGAGRPPAVLALVAARRGLSAQRRARAPRAGAHRPGRQRGAPGRAAAAWPQAPARDR